MKKIFHHIRRQPEETKRYILHILILCFAVILFFLWTYSLGTTLTSTDTEEQIKKDLKPFSVLKDNITDGYNSIKESDLNITQ
ncbi:MAG: hypothetical protein WCW93_03205 [Candidatus Paceibacterota bacterium]